MDDQFKIYVEQLRDGHTETISEQLDPAFLEINEKELAFPYPVEVEGEAYLADDSLILKFEIKAKPVLLCAICNAPVEVPMEIHELYHAEPIEDIKSGIFNFKELLRENIISEVPTLAECNQGKCPERNKLAKYFKNSSSKASEGEEGYQPFADFDWDKKDK